MLGLLGSGARPVRHGVREGESHFEKHARLEAVATKAKSRAYVVITRSPQESESRNFRPQRFARHRESRFEKYARLKAAATKAKSRVTLGGTMALTFSIVDTWEDGKRVHVSGTVVASGNYTTSGDTLDLSQVPLIASDQPPVQGTAWMDGLAGYDYVFVPGVAMNSNKVKIFQQGAAAGPFPELAAGAYPAAITADTITFYGIFKKLQ